jgi:hypothetical protein
MTARKRGNLSITEHEPNFFRTSFLNSASASTNYFSPATTVRFSFSRIIAESTGAGMLVLIGLKSRQGCLRFWFSAGGSSPTAGNALRNTAARRGISVPARRKVERLPNVETAVELGSLWTKVCRKKRPT